MTGLQQEYLHHLLGGRRMAAQELIMDAYRSGCTIHDLYQDVLQESLYEAGRLWESNRISVSDEHVCTMITQCIMTELYRRLERSALHRGRVVMTGVRGEVHQIGANMVSDVLEADGWDVMFLGADVPTGNVIDAVRKHDADILGISVTMVAGIADAARLVETVRQEYGAESPVIILGGGAFQTTALLPNALEQCLQAHNLRESIDLARGLCRTIRA